MVRVGTGIAPPGTHPVPNPGYTPYSTVSHAGQCTGQYGGVNMVVGLNSVGQLTLDA